MSQTLDRSSIITLINTFALDAGNRQRLVDLLIRMVSSAAHRVLFLRRSIAASTVQRWPCMRSGAASRTIRPCARTPALCHSSKRRSPSQSLNRVSTRACGLSCLSVVPEVRPQLPSTEDRKGDALRQRQLRQCASYTVRRNCRSHKRRHFSLLRIRSEFTGNRVITHTIGRPPTDPPAGIDDGATSRWCVTVSSSARNFFAFCFAIRHGEGQLHWVPVPSFGAFK
jgi:hypothetical protein